MNPSIRKDGRHFSDTRQVSVGLSAFELSSTSTIGSSLVQIGSTRVACGILLQVGTPSQSFPDQGDIGKQKSFIQNFLLFVLIFQTIMIIKTLR